MQQWTLKVGQHGSPHLLGQPNHHPPVDQLLPIFHSPWCWGSSYPWHCRGYIFYSPFKCSCINWGPHCISYPAASETPRRSSWYVSQSLEGQKTGCCQICQAFSSMIQDYNFQVGSLVLVCNSCIEKELNCKTKPCFLSIMVVVHWTKWSASLWPS